ncbi:unnamed protein product [Polarella glacialis]|uniref:Uncharacterized protein n=1 Tax=Polarella glacialis TaxID=89957 RepID=A0A813FFZ8_POLGL|nr:unnamed protein product [Polarella glacialis]
MRDKKTQLDSLWFPKAAAAYLQENGADFCYTVIIDSDTLFVKPLGQFLPQYSACKAKGQGQASNLPEPDWDVAFTVYDPEFVVPWADDPADAGRTRHGYSRINCGVVLLNVLDTNLAVRFLRKWVLVSEVLMAVDHYDATGELEAGQAAEVFSESPKVWAKWQQELVKEFRGNDQAGLALLVCAYDTERLQDLLGWGSCQVCAEPVTAQLSIFHGEREMEIRFKAVPARMLNHPESMRDGLFQPDLHVVHLKGLWWRVILGKGIAGITDTRKPYWNRQAVHLWNETFTVWQVGLPEEFRLQSTPRYLLSDGTDISDQINKMPNKPFMR